MQINAKLFYILRMKLNSDDSIEALKENVSMCILKPTTQIHIFYQQHEIR